MSDLGGRSLPEASHLWGWGVPNGRQRAVLEAATAWRSCRI